MKPDGLIEERFYREGLERVCVYMCVFVCGVCVCGVWWCVVCVHVGTHEQEGEIN